MRTPGKSGEVRVVDWSSGNVLLTCARTTDVLLDLTFNPDGTRLAVAGTDGLIRIVEVATGNTLQRSQVMLTGSMRSLGATMESDCAQPVEINPQGLHSRKR